MSFFHSVFYLLSANIAIEKWGSYRITSKYCHARRTYPEISNSSAAVKQDILQDLSFLFSGNSLTATDNLDKGSPSFLIFLNCNKNRYNIKLFFSEIGSFL